MSRIEGPWDLFTDIAQPPSEPGRPEIVLLAGFLGLHLARPDGPRIWLTPPAFALRDVATELSLGSDAAPLVPDGLNEIFVDASPLFSIPTAHILSVRFSTGDAYAEGSIAVRRPRRAAGDGTITARAAMSRGGPVYRVDLPHTLIPLDPKAISGVIELARTGATSLPLVSEEEANAPIEGQEPTVDDIAREYVETTLTHPERISQVLKLCVLFGPPGA